jgi:type VI secretion system protein ImpH
MDAAVRHQSADLIDSLAHPPREYSFFQLVRRLERACLERGLPGAPVDRWLHFAPGPHMSFPASDVLDCRADGGRIRVELGFMGLYGVDAPLPHYLLDLAAGDDAQAEVLRRFLDLFSHRFYALLYLAWRKYRPHLHGQDRDTPFMRYLCAMAGSSAARGAMAYAGLFGARRRTAAALTGMVSEWLDGMPVKVCQFQPVWVALADRTRLGGTGACRLGQDTMLGDRVLDCAGRISLRIGPVPLEKVRPLLPGSRNGEGLTALVRRYLGPALPFDLTFLVEPPKGGQSRLGDEGLVLGCAVWLGSPRGEGRPYPVRIPGTAYRMDEPDGPVPARSAA